MTTKWLESEEEKTALAEKKRILESNAKNILDKQRDEDRIQKEEILKKNLGIFFNLCDRINKLDNNPYLLSISNLKVFSKKDKKATNNWYDYYSDYREISFSITETNQILIEIRCYQERYRQSYLQETIEKMLLSKKCLNQDILNWEEEKMISTIRWIIFQFDNIKKNLPKPNEGFIREINANNENLRDSILFGVLCGIIGLIVGLIVGLILGYIIWGILAFFHNDIGDQGIRNIKIATSALSTIYGFYFGYVIKRKEY